MPLAEYVRSWNIDNFSIRGNDLRVGSRHWKAEECQCGLPECAGWSIFPARDAAPKRAHS